MFKMYKLSKETWDKGYDALDDNNLEVVIEQIEILKDMGTKLSTIGGDILGPTCLGAYYVATSNLPYAPIVIAALISVPAPFGSYMLGVGAGDLIEAKKLDGQARQKTRK